jgi:alcohol dehydrogenase
MLLKNVISGRLKPKRLVTHEFKLGEMMNAYDTFADAATQKALKVLIHS